MLSAKKSYNIKEFKKKNSVFLEQQANFFGKSTISMHVWPFEIFKDQRMIFLVSVHTWSSTPGITRLEDHYLITLWTRMIGRVNRMPIE